MTSHASGRHRRRLPFPLSPSSAGFDYPGAHVRRSADRRAFTLVLSASVAGVTAAAIVGSLAPLNSTWMADGGTRAASGPSPANVLGAAVPWSAVPWSVGPLASLVGPAAARPQLPGAGPGPGSARPPGDRTAGQPGRHRKNRPGSAAQNHAAQNHAARNHRAGHNHHAAQNHAAAQNHGAQNHAAAQDHAAGQNHETGQPGAVGTSPQSGAAGAEPSVVVSYFVDREWAGGFQGQVRVVNNGSQPVAGWQAVIALPRDRVTWYWNATGLVSHHVMLLRPLSADEVVPAGGTLSLFFTATGPDATPQACAFDGVTCG